MEPRPLDEIRVLVVEDEYFIADDIKRALNGAGASVIGPVSTLNAAQTALNDGSFDWAVVYLNLHEESALPIAEVLLDDGKPFVIATGYDSGVLPNRHGVIAGSAPAMLEWPKVAAPH